MKILMVNKFLYPKGGSETYVLKLGDILEQKGHEVQYFGMRDDRNTVGNRVDALAAPMDFHKGIKANLLAPLRIIYNAEARKQIRRVLEDFQPDVVHLNNIQFHLTPSIILETNAYRKRTGCKVNVVYTAHDYQMICASHGLFDTQLNVCEKCLDGNYTHCLRTKCVKNSYSKSLLGMIDAYVWRWLPAYNYVDTIICCSRFLKSKLDTQERLRSKTVAIHNFTDDKLRYIADKQGYVLEFGHLSKDKGTLTLLEVARRMPGTKFVFAGYGAAVEEIENQPNANYEGFKTGGELEILIRQAAVSVCPSEWYENCPFSVIESQMYGTPVIGSRMGGIPELIQEERTGEIFEAGNPDDLEKKLRSILENPERLQAYTQNCLQAQFETPESYYEKLMGVYTK